MNNKIIFDCAVIGNGAIGCALAIMLGVKHKTKTVLIGSSERSFSGSTAAGAMLNCYAEITEETFIFPHNEKFNLAKSALEFWDEWLTLIQSQTDIDILYGKGTTVFSNGLGGQLDAAHYNRIERYLIENHIPYSDDLENAAPSGNQAQRVRSLYLPEEGYVHPPSLFQAYDDIIQRCENILGINEHLVSIYQKSGHYELCFDNGESILAHKLVLTAGVFNSEIMKMLPHAIDLMPQFASVGYSLQILSEKHALKQVMRTPNRGGGCGFHLLPYGENHLYFGSTAFISPILVHDPIIYYINNLFRSCLEQFDRDFLFSKITNIFVGHRPFPLDKLPLIGPIHESAIWIISGFNRDGFHCAPKIAHDVSSELFANQESQYHLFSPLRKPFAIRTIEESIHYFCDFHYLSFLMEMEPKLSSLHDEYILEGIRNDITSIYEHLNISYGLDPEILWMLLRLHKKDLTSYYKIASTIQKVFKNKN